MDKNLPDAGILKLQSGDASYHLATLVFLPHLPFTSLPMLLKSDNHVDDIKNSQVAEECAQPYNVSEIYLG